MDEQCMNFNMNEKWTFMDDFIHNDDGQNVDHDVGDVIWDNGKQQGFPRSVGCKALLVWISLWGKLNIKNDQMQDLP